MGPHKATFRGEVQKALKNNIPEKDSRNGLLLSILCCVDKNHLFLFLPLLEHASMILKGCGEIFLVERRWGYCKWTLVGILAMY